MPGLKGNAINPDEIGILGDSNQLQGLRGVSHAAWHAGVVGLNDDSSSHAGPGVFGHSDNGEGVRGYSRAARHAGVVGINDNPSTDPNKPAGPGVFGHSDNSTGVVGESDLGIGVLGHSDSSTGVLGESTLGVGVQGNGPDAGVRGFSDFGNAIHGISGHLAGLFEGQVKIHGASLEVTKIGNVGGEIVAEAIFAKNKHFIIDHPCDPENKYLVHASVESSEMMNIYSGVAVLDENGEALVELPEWFEALNGDFRYQLTCIGCFSPVYIAEKVRNNRFKIGGGSRNSEVSWQLVGVRKDAWAVEHPLVLVRDKTADPVMRHVVTRFEATGATPFTGGIETSERGEVR